MIKRTHRRRLAAALILAGAPLNVLCFYQHVCGCGHMQHGPYAAWHYVLDAVWMGCFLLGSVLARSPDRWLAWALFFFAPLFVVSRLVLGLIWGLTPPLIELGVLPAVIVIAVICLILRAKPPRAREG